MGSELRSYDPLEGDKTPISNGPSKMDLMFSLFHYETRGQQRLLFQVIYPSGAGVYYQLRIEALELESRENNDSGGNHWRFKATMVDSYGEDCGIVHGRYNTYSRTGWMKGRSLTSA
jgi:hypothetical protein